MWDKKEATLRVISGFCHWVNENCLITQMNAVLKLHSKITGLFPQKT